MSAAESPAPIRVLVADDQKVVRDGVSLLLRQLPGVEVVGAAGDGDEAVRQALEAEPDVVLTDLNMPLCDGIEATRRIVQARPEVRVVALTAYCDDDSVCAALRAGALGFLTKDAGAGEILRALSAVAAGEAQLDPSVQRRLVEAFTRGERAGFPAARHLPDPRADGLTSREIEVLSDVAAGLSNAEIAAKLIVSAATVKTHINHLLAKTGARDRAQLVAYAFQRGLAG
ncbi:MAG: response regulator [Streptosporangiaceae bacterium]